MSDNDSQEIELPPDIVKFQEQLKADRKMLLRDKAYGQSAEQLRAFIGQYMFTRMSEMMELLSFALYDTYSLAVSSENQIQRMRAVYGSAFKKLGADVGDERGDLPGVSPEVMDDFQQAFFALGALLQAKLPEDQETQAAFNKCALILSDMIGELMGDDDDEDDGEGGEEPEKSESKPETKSDGE